MKRNSKSEQMTRVHPLAIEAKKKWKEDIKAGHGAGEEYWAGYAGAAFLMSNPTKKCPYCRKPLKQAITNRKNKTYICMNESCPAYAEYMVPKSKWGNPTKAWHENRLRQLRNLPTDYMTDWERGNMVGRIDEERGSIEQYKGKVHEPTFEEYGKATTAWTNPRKMSSTRVMKGRKYFYAGRTIYMSKALSVMNWLRHKGIGTALSKSKGKGLLIWSTEPVMLDLTEPITASNPILESLGAGIIAGVGFGTGMKAVNKMFGDGK